MKIILLISVLALSACNIEEDDRVICDNNNGQQSIDLYHSEGGVNDYIVITCNDGESFLYVEDGNGDYDLIGGR